MDKAFCMPKYATVKSKTIRDKDTIQKVSKKRRKNNPQWKNNKIYVIQLARNVGSRSGIFRENTHILKFYIQWNCPLNMRISENIPKHMGFRTYQFERNFWRKYEIKIKGCLIRMQWEIEELGKQFT